MSDIPTTQPEAVLEKRRRRLLRAHGYPQASEGDQRKSHDLEYRAKLTEILYADSTLRPILSRFIAN